MRVPQALSFDSHPSPPHGLHGIDMQVNHADARGRDVQCLSRWTGPRELHIADLKSRANSVYENQV
jgi:hypothetical protein